MSSSSYDDLVAACRSIDPEPIADLTMDLVDIWSPPGDEAAVAERLADEFTAIGARVRLDRTYDASPSVIVEFGQDTGRTMQWHGHLDAIDAPHDKASRSANRLIGRGTADMKGSDAAMVTAARLLIERGLPEQGRVLVTLHGMHESGGNEPLHDLISRGIHGDAVITGELGGGVELPIAGLGLTFWEITVSRPGSSVHEVMASPDTIDPVEVGRQLHSELGALRDRLAGLDGPAPRPSLFVGRFVAGDYINRIPVRAELSGTRRHDETSTQQDVADELEALVDNVRSSTGAEISLGIVAVADSFEVDAGEAIVSSMIAAHRDLTGAEIPLTRSKVATNAVHFVREAGIPAVGYGPDPSTNHSDLESIDIDELSRIAGGFALATARFLDSGTSVEGEQDADV